MYLLMDSEVTSKPNQLVWFLGERIMGINSKKWFSLSPEVKKSPLMIRFIALSNCNIILRIDTDLRFLVMKSIHFTGG